MEVGGVGGRRQEQGEMGGVDGEVGGDRESSRVFVSGRIAFTPYLNHGSLE